MKLYFLILVLILVNGFVVGQQPKPSPTPSDEFECGLTYAPLVKLYVSVWNPRENVYVSNLNYTDFEITDARKTSQEIHYFIRPTAESRDEEAVQHYVLGFTIDDFQRHKWRKIKIRLRPTIDQDFVVIAPNGYFY